MKSSQNHCPTTGTAATEGQHTRNGPGGGRPPAYAKNNLDFLRKRKPCYYNELQTPVGSRNGSATCNETAPPAVALGLCAQQVPPPATATNSWRPPPKPLQQPACPILATSCYERPTMRQVRRSVKQGWLPRRTFTSRFTTFLSLEMQY